MSCNNRIKHALCGVFLLGFTLPVHAQTLAQKVTLPPQEQPRISSDSEDTGMISLPSPFSVKTTSARLLSILQKEKFRVFADIDHQGNANSVKLALRPTRLIIFGNPNVGTQLMHENQTLGIDLPMKFLVWEAIDHRVYISWNNPYYLAKRHGISPKLTLLSKISKKLYEIAEAASHSPKK